MQTPTTTAQHTVTNHPTIELTAHKKSEMMAQSLDDYAGRIRALAETLRRRKPGEAVRVELLVSTAETDVDFLHHCGKHGGKVGIVVFCNGGDGGGDGGGGE